MSVAARLNYYRRVSSAYLLPGKSQLTFWHDQPQVNSDVFGMFQSLVEGRAVPRELLVKDVPPEFHNDLDYLIGMLDWDANTDPEFYKHRHFDPAPVAPPDWMADAGYCEKWIVYSTPHYSAKELTVFPGRSVTIRVAAGGSVGVRRLMMNCCTTPTRLPTIQYSTNPAGAEVSVDGRRVDSKDHTLPAAQPVTYQLKVGKRRFMKVRFE
jgi:hypothetical protein